MKITTIIILCLVSNGLLAQITPGITPTVLPLQVVTQNGTTITLSVQPYASVHTSEEGTIYTGWFPYIFSNGTTAVKDVLLKEDIQIGPNPAKDEIFIKSSNKGSAIWHLTIFDSNGRLMARKIWSAHQQEYNLNIKPIPIGTFFLLFYDPALSKYRIEKFIKID